MLYLPCGWFHEVTSFSTTVSNDNQSESFHMALNYWFHPPDNLEYQEKEKIDEIQPYLSSFWEDDWTFRTFNDFLI